jgi:hypothetical protein
MTHADIRSRLAEVESAISLATGLVHRQKEVVADFERRGHECIADLANEVLVTLEESLRAHIEDRDRIKRELDAAMTTQAWRP